MEGHFAMGCLFLNLWNIGWMTGIRRKTVADDWKLYTI